MRLIAFDLEACNRYVPGSIFSIGIVESDLQFNIKKRYNILINPETKFVTKFRKPIEFNVNQNELKNKPNFKKAYTKLNKIFNKDAIFIAHSISNDIRMLNYACKRYKLPSFNFQFICSQMIYSIYSNIEDNIGLNNAADLININFHHHMAEEDAFISMKIIEFICKVKNCSFNNLIKDYKITYGKLYNFQISLMKSEKLNEQRKIRKEKRLQNNNSNDN